ncbi:MAG: VWA domain-containing protein [Planctomycetota bacterium]
MASENPPPAAESDDLAPPRRPASAMTLSLLVHLVLVLLLVFWASGSQRGTGEAVDRQIGIARVHRLPDRNVYEEVTSESESATQAQADSAASAAAAPPADLSPPLDLDGLLAAMESTPMPSNQSISGTGISGDLALGDDSFGDGGSSNLGELGEKGSANLFGVSGSGNRFVYVLDRSDSMNGFGGRPLASAKAELIRSLRSLTRGQQFQVIFYNENVKPFQVSGSPLTMITGQSSEVDRAERYIASIRAFGGTKHLGALKLALRMSPDVVFFLTDADRPRPSSLQLQDIQRRAEQSGTSIHAVEFGSLPNGAPDSFLRDLAAMNNGQYQYVDVRKLKQLAEPGPEAGE